MKTLLLAWQSARSDTLRSALSVFTLTLGILGLVTVVSAQSVLTETVSQRALMTGGPTTTLLAEVSGVSAPDELEHYTRLLQSRTSAVQASSEIWRSGVVGTTPDHRKIELEVRAVSGGFPQIFPVALQFGEWPPIGASLSPRALLNIPAARALGQESFPLLDSGGLVQITPTGTLSDGAIQPRLYFPLESFDALGPGEEQFFTVLSGPALTKDGVNAAAKQLSSFRGDITVREIIKIDTVAQLHAELATSGQVLLTLGVLSLGSTLFGILNLGLATSKARSREFALRRVLGASRIQISLVTILESQIIAFLAASIAFALSWALFPLVVHSFRLPLGVGAPEFSPTIGSISFIVATVSALLASLVPAVLSFRKDFSEVMRY